MDTLFTLYFSTYHNESRKYVGTSRNVRNFIVSRMAELGFDGATLSQPQGVWQGAWEHSYKLEIVGRSQDMLWIKQMAMDIRDHYKQDSVMVTAVAADVEFV